MREKIEFVIYFIIGGLVVNLLANMIWKYLPRTNTYTYEIVSFVALTVICLLLVIFKKSEHSTDRISRPDTVAPPLTKGEPERVVGDMPSAVAQHFIGRESELDWLRKHLANENLRLMLVCGRGGIGKTTLIVKLLRDLERSNLSLQIGTDTLVVDSIVYAPLNQREFCSIDRIVLDLIYRTLEPEVGEALRSKWKENGKLGDKLEFLFHSILKARRCLIVLDNLEDVLDEDNHIRDEFDDLREFVEHCTEYDHTTRIIATSRRTLVLSPKLEGHIGERRAELSLSKGLPDDQAIKLLRELDTNGRKGIRDASDETLRQVVHRCHGIPKMLETLVGALRQKESRNLVERMLGRLFSSLRQKRRRNLTQLLADKGAFADLVENPAQELYKSLSTKERRVMQALAVYDRPVSADTVRYLLPTLPVDDLLEDLVDNYAVTNDHAYFSLHPIDKEYAYTSLTAGERTKLHSLVVDTLESEFPDAREKLASELADHCTEAKRYEDAVTYRIIAAQRAYRIQNYSEQVFHCKRGISDVKEFAPNSERLRYEVIFHLGLANAYRHSIELDKEEHVGDELLRLAQQHGNPVAEIEGCLAICHVAAVRGDESRVLQYSEKAWNTARQSNIGRHLVRVAACVGYGFYKFIPEQLKERLDETIDLCRRESTTALLVKALQSRGEIAYWENDTDLALSLFTQALEHAELVENNDEQFTKDYPFAQSYSSLASIVTSCIEYVRRLCRRHSKFNWGQFKQYLDKTIDRYRNEKALTFLPRVLQSRGIIAFVENEDDLALSLLTESIKTAEWTFDADERDPRTAPFIVTHHSSPMVDHDSMEYIGRIYRRCREWEKAISQFWQVYEHKRAGKNMPGESGLLNMIAETQLLASAAENAEQSFEQSWTIAQQASSFELKAMVLATGISISLSLENDVEAERRLRLFEEVPRDGDTRWRLHKSQMTRGILSLRAGDIDRAQSLLKDGLKMVQEEGDPELIIQYSLWLATLNLRNGNLDLALHYTGIALQSARGHALWDLGEARLKSAQEKVQSNQRCEAMTLIEQAIESFQEPFLVEIYLKG